MKGIHRSSLRAICVALAALTLPLSGSAVEMLDEFPRLVHPGESYVIYSHGRIVEGEDAKPVHPQHGVYDFPAIKAALFRNGGFNLIAPHRRRNADGPTYVATLESWVHRLVASGVSPNRITLVGFSRGAELTAMAASRLREAGISTALLAACTDGDYQSTPSISLGGRVLSLYETTDAVGSCAILAKRSKLASFEEIPLTTGKGHGAFYQPLPEWVEPLKDWIARAQGNTPVGITGSTRIPVHSRILDRHYDLYVKVPPGYFEPRNASRRYPVVYVNDGAWTFAIASGVTQLPMGEGAIEGAILVGLGYAKELGSDSRIRDYTPTVNRAFEKQTGEADRYLAFLEQEVFRLIEARFRVDASRRIYAGHSFGGLFGAYALFARPGLFKCFILSSPSLWFDQHRIWEIESKYADAHRDLRAEIYMAIGSLERLGVTRGSQYDMVKDVQTLERKLAGRNYPGLRLRTFVIDGATHETAFPAAFLNGILWHLATDRATPYKY